MNWPWSVTMETDNGKCWIAELSPNIDLWATFWHFHLLPKVEFGRSEDTEKLDIYWLWFWLGWTRRKMVANKQRTAILRIKDIFEQYINDAPRRVEEEMRMRVSMLGDDAHLDPDPTGFVYHKFEGANPHYMLELCDRALAKTTPASMIPYFLGRLAGALMLNGICTEKEAVELTGLEYV